MSFTHLYVLYGSARRSLRHSRPSLLLQVVPHFRRLYLICIISFDVFGLTVLEWLSNVSETRLGDPEAD